MFRQEERATISIRSLGSLIRVTGKKAKLEEALIDSILDELKKGNFERIEEFEKLADDLLNNILENIKVYAQRDENQKIEMIYQFLSDFFNYHLFDALDNKTIDEIKSAFDKDLNQLISDLRQEKRDERTIRHGRKPIHTMFKRMFRSNRSLDRQVMREGIKIIALENEEEGVRKSLKQLLIILTKERSKLSKEQVEYLKNKARELLLKFATIILQEFEAIHEAEVDVETQEADLIAEIKEIMNEAKNNQKVYDQLQAIIAKIESHLKTDFYVAKRMLDKTRTLKQSINERFVQAEKGKKEIPLVTEFPTGMVVLNVKNKKLVVLNPNYLLGKHGTGTEEVGSKFNQLKTSNQLYKVLVSNLSPDKLSGGRIELRELDTGVNVGTDGLITIDEMKQWGTIQVEDVRGNPMNVVYTDKRIPGTSLLNIILVEFNPQFGMNVDKDFFVKYGKAFSEFEGVYAILTMFPGKYAPAANDRGFWDKHALLKNK